jgi:hypothetical protein
MTGEPTFYYWNELTDHLGRHPTPMAVFSKSLDSVISARISGVTRHPYNHFMWLDSPTTVISQDWMLRRRWIEEYTDQDHILKFVTSDTWEGQRDSMRRELVWLVNRPWYYRLYDVLQIVGHRLGMPWLHIPGLSICSDLGRVIHRADPEYNLRHATPADVDNWMRARSRVSGMGAYYVVCRYAPEAL